MQSYVAWLLELAVKEGELENVKTLIQEMVEATKRREPGALIYEWSLSEDEQHCHIYERYKDSAAVVTHLKNFNEHFAERFLSSLEPARLRVYGNPSDEAKEALSGLGAVFMTEIGGFTR